MTALSQTTLAATLRRAFALAAAATRRTLSGSAARDALRGFGAGAAIGLLLAGGLTGLGMNLGLGAATDFAVGMALMGLILFLVDGLLALMRTMWRGAIRLSVRVSSRGAAALRGVAGAVGRVPRIFFIGAGGVILACGMKLLVGLPVTVRLDPAAEIIIPGCALAGLLVAGGRGARPQARPVLMGLATGCALAAPLWLAWPGTDAYLVQPAPAEQSVVPLLELRDPGQLGVYPVRYLTYGSGTDRRRPEYGREVVFVTPTVDASAALEELSGFPGAYNRWFWGFDSSRLPLNGRVWYPAGSGPFPIVLIVHGNHSMGEGSDSGYAYLGEHLASNGFIAVSVDQNFLNGSWVGDYDGREMPVRAWLLLEHLQQWRAWNAQPDHPLYGKVDLGRVALIGHSRGGEAAVHASELNWMLHAPLTALASDGAYNFGIRAVVALAPSEGQYKPGGMSVKMTHANYLLITGAHDGDTFQAQGVPQYNRVSFADNPDGFKANVYLYRANHGQFNTVWGANDRGWTGSHLLNRRPYLAGAAQRQAARVFVGAFLQATLQGQDGYRALFRNASSGRNWLPADVVVTTFEDSTFLPLSAGDLGGGAAQPNVILSNSGAPDARRVALTLRSGMPQGNWVLRLGWDAGAAAVHTVTLPEGAAAALELDGADSLTFALADAGDGRTPPVVSVALATTDGVTVTLPLAQFAAVPPPLPTQQVKSLWLAQRYHLDWTPVAPVERILQTFDVPLSAFAAADPAFRVDHLSRVALQFGGGPGAVYLDQIGFRRG